MIVLARVASFPSDQLLVKFAYQRNGFELFKEVLHIGHVMYTSNLPVSTRVAKEPSMRLINRSMLKR